jgi:hypothetical protein
MNGGKQPPFARPDLADLAAEQLAPLEALMAEFPDVWRDFARSQFQTLMGLHPSRAAFELAAESVELTRGIALDLGGTQPYIPVGHYFASDARTMRVVNSFTGNNHQELALREGITERRVRQILTAYGRAQFELRQGTLALD